MRKTPAALRTFLSSYDPDIARLFLATRKVVLAAAPGTTELIYDAYNAVSAAYSFTDRLKDAFCHVAAYRRYVNLGFNRGVDLPDPHRVLVGTGANIRHIRIAEVADLERPEVRTLIRAAVAQGRQSTLGGATPHTVVRAVYAKKRRPSR